MPLNTWATTLNGQFNQLFSGIIMFLPNILVAIIIFIVGWLVGMGLGRVVAQVINALRVDQALKSTGIERVLSRAGFQLNVGKFLGMLVEWFFIIVFLLASLQIVGLTQVNAYITQVLAYLPNVIVAVLILLVTAVLAEAAGNVVAGSAKAAEMHAAGFLNKVARYTIWVFGVLAALDQLKVAPAFVSTLFTGIVIAVSLAIGLAFGLGGQAAAARYLDKMQSEMKD